MPMTSSNSKPALPVYEVEEIPAERRLREERRRLGEAAKKVEAERRKSAERREPSKK
jgi:hypothetical protein